MIKGRCVGDQKLILNAFHSFCMWLVNLWAQFIWITVVWYLYFLPSFLGGRRGGGF